MPSVLLSRASGHPFPLMSGNFWSGTGNPHPVGEVRLFLSPDASGLAYVGYSGGATINSGTYFLSGSYGSGASLADGGFLDMMPIKPGERYAVPRLAFGPSGQLGIYVTCESGCSGQARMYWEAF